MTGLHALVVGRQRQRRLCREQRRAFGLRIVEVAAQAVHIGVLEVEGRELALGPQEHVAVLGAVAVPIEVVDVVDALHVHGEALHAVGELDGDRVAVDPPHLLEVGELRHLHAVAPDLPAEAPGAERRALPIVLDEADVVGVHVDAEHPQANEILVLHVLGRGLQDHLELVVVLEPVGVLAVAPVAGPAGGLHVGRAPGLRAQAAERRRGMEGAGAHLHVVGLEDDAAPLGPIGLQAKDERLERPVASSGVHRRSAIRVNGRADNAPRLGSGQPRGCRPAAAGARALAVVVDVLVLVVLERLRRSGLGAHPADCLEAEPDHREQQPEEQKLR